MSESVPQRKSHRKLWGVVTIVAILLLGIPLGAYHQAPPTPQQQFQNAIQNDISVTLTVKAYHHGSSTPFANRTVPNDLIVDGFNKFLVDFFAVGDAPARLSSSPYTIIGTTNSCGAFGCGAVMEIGTSGTAPSRGDSALGAGYTPSAGTLQFANTAINTIPTTTASPSTCNTGATDSVSGISGSQTITSSVTIQEAGLFYAQASYAMVSHDTFTGIVVVSGDTVTVAYQINLSNAGFTTNFCNWLAGVLAGNVAQTGHVTVSLTNTASSTNQFYAICNGLLSYTSALYTTGCATASAAGKMGIGTGNTAFTPASVQLNSQVGSRTAISADAYLSPNPFWTTTFTITGSNTIQEAGIFLTLSGTDYLFFATTFTGQAETTLVPFGFTMRIGD